MKHITVGREFNRGKIAFVECVKNDPLKNIEIKNKCFLLILLTSGKLEFSVGDNTVSALAPSFICFDETEDPILLKNSAAKYICIYFHPKYLNVNMCFGLLRSKSYRDIASVHDMFMLKPFVDKAYVIPIRQTGVEKIEASAEYMQRELAEQRDWYWSCRGRSYFMEIIIALERMYGLMGYGIDGRSADSAPAVENPLLREAILFIESHYGEALTLSDISLGAGINHTTLTSLMKKELGCTAMEYLTNHRIAVAKKQLAFTEVPIKDITVMVGFKTVQHFGRVFKTKTDMTPAEFRKNAVERRKREIK